MHRTRTRMALIGAAASLALLTAACGSDSNAASDTDMASSPSPSAMNASEPFGDGCAAVPMTGSGSFVGMASDPVATAASNNPLLSTLVTAVKAAGLVDTLNGADGVTVFAPVNDAFSKVPKATLDGLLADPKGSLTKVLTYHVVPGQLTPDQLAGTHKTLEGQNLTVTGSGEDFTVNDTAKVICGDVHTANATVYIIDGVLTPPAG